MAALSAVDGRMEKPTDTASAPVPRARANTPGPGPTGSRWSGYTPGPVEIHSRATGRRGNGTGSAWSPRGGGCTAGSGVTD